MPILQLVELKAARAGLKVVFSGILTSPTGGVESKGTASLKRDEVLRFWHEGL